MINFRTLYPNRKASSGLGSAWQGTRQKKKPWTAFGVRCGSARCIACGREDDIPARAATRSARWSSTPHCRESSVT